MKKKTDDIEYDKFKDMAMYLLASKAFSDYLAAECPEPEHFFDRWMSGSMFEPDDDMKLWTWRYFISKLIIYRKTHKI
jgi:hypothetical protein